MVREPPIVWSVVVEVPSRIKVKLVPHGVLLIELLVTLPPTVIEYPPLVIVELPIVRFQIRPSSPARSKLLLWQH